MVEKVRKSFFPALNRHATNILACTSMPQQQAYSTSMVLSFRSRREKQRDHKVCFVCSPQKGGGASRFSGPANRRGRGPQAARPPDRHKHRKSYPPPSSFF